MPNSTRNEDQLKGMIRDTEYPPHTGLSTGRPVEAVGFFREFARGKYSIKNIPPGIYDVYVHADNHPWQKVIAGKRIREGSTTINIILNQ